MRGGGRFGAWQRIGSPRRNRALWNLQWLPSCADTAHSDLASDIGRGERVPDLGFADGMSAVLIRSLTS